MYVYTHKSGRSVRWRTMTDEIAKRAADAGWATGFAVWWTLHVAQINEGVQLIIGLLTIVSLIAAIRFHWKNTK